MKLFLSALLVLLMIGISHSAADLIALAKKGDLNGVKAALSAGAKVDTSDAHGNTALHWVSWFGKPEILDVLIVAGASVDQVDNKRERNTALHKASFNAHTEGHESVIRSLIAAGATVDARNLHEMTPLMNAAMRGYHKTAQILIDGGADVKAVDKGGVTPLTLTLTLTLTLKVESPLCIKRHSKDTTRSSRCSLPQAPTSTPSAQTASHR